MAVRPQGEQVVKFPDAPVVGVVARPKKFIDALEFFDPETVLRKKFRDAAARKKIRIKILNYGISLLKEIK